MHELGMLEGEMGSVMQFCNSSFSFDSAFVEIVRNQQGSAKCKIA